MAILQTRQLEHKFPDGTLALEGIDLSFEEGEFTVITGANGSGKSVLSRHLNGLLAPTRGTVYFRGEGVTRKNLSLLRRKVGMVFQNPDSQFLGQTVEEDVAFGPGNLGLSREEVAFHRDRALEITGLAHLRECRPYLLSGGEKRRLAIAGVLAMEPEVIIFDEPFSNLDFDGVCQVTRELIKLKEQGKTIILITHDLGKVLAYTCRLVVMRKGQVLYSGPAAPALDRLEPWGVRRPPGEDTGGMTWLS